MIIRCFSLASLTFWSSPFCSRLRISEQELAFPAAAASVFFDLPSGIVYAIAGFVTLLGTVFRPAEAAILPTLARTPEELFDQQWARDVHAAALEELKRRLEGEGKGDVYRAFAAYVVEPEREGVTYADVAGRTGLSETQVTNHLHVARERFQQVLWELVSSYVASREDLERELRELFAV